MTSNLQLQRAEPSVWDAATKPEWDAERWMAALGAGALIALGARGGRRAAPMFVAGAALAWWASCGIMSRNRVRGQVIASLPHRGPQDPVREASEDSFPASDPPAWTGTTAKSDSVRG